MAGGGGANVLRLDEEDYVHRIDDAFTAQQMVRAKPWVCQKSTSWPVGSD